MSAFATLDELTALRIWDGVAGRVVNSERLTLAVVELDPESAVPEHSHDQEQVGVCIAGSLRFRVGEETRDLGPGGTWCILAGVPHEVETGPKGAVVIETFSPRRDDWAGLSPTDARPSWPR